jgi:hypothetical protein
MLIGSKIQLRTARAGELDELYPHNTNLSTRGARAGAQVPVQRLSEEAASQ